MKTDIIEKNKVPLYARTEVIARITFTGSTPDNETVKQALASNMKVDKSLIIIGKISTDYGFSGAKVTALVYDNKDSLEIYAPKMGKKAKEKIAKAKEKKKAAAEKPKEPKADAPEEKPAAEEKPAEKKPAEEKTEEKAEEKPAAEEKAEDPAKKGE